MDKEQFAGKRIAVLAGGDTGEREVSLRSGRGVYEALVRQGLDAVMVDPTADLVHQLAEVGADLVYNALHGGAGEDGTIQALLDLAGIPYTGPGVLASALTMHKLQTKRILQAVGLPTPAYAAIDTPPDADTLESIIKSLELPVVTKPVSEGSSLGITICRDSETLIREIQALLKCYGELFVEAFIPGVELTVGVLGSGAGAYALPVLEIAPKREFYDYEAKYVKGLTDLICPARIPDAATSRAQQVALETHRVFGCQGISRCDMVMDVAGEMWVLEINSCPGMTETSDVPHEAFAAGMTYDDVVLEVLKSALERARARPAAVCAPPPVLDEG